MIEKRLRDKAMAKKLIEELMGETMIETPNGLELLEGIKVAGFDQDIFLKDMTEDYGWIGAWMHLCDVIGSTVSQSGRVFSEAYRLNPEWIGRIEAIRIDDLSPEHVLSDDYQNDREDPKEMSSGLVQLTMRLALMESIKIDSKGHAIISAPDYQERSIQRAAEQADRIFPVPQRSTSTQDMFFSILRKSISPALVVDHEHTLVNTKDS